MATTHATAHHVKAETHAKAEEKPKAKEHGQSVQVVTAGTQEEPGKIKRDGDLTILVVQGDGCAQLPKAGVGDRFEIHGAGGSVIILCPEGENFQTGETSARPAVFCTKLGNAVWGKLNG